MERVCRRCGYQWYSGKETPKQCPECRTTLWESATSAITYSGGGKCGQCGNGPFVGFGGLCYTCRLKNVKRAQRLRYRNQEQEREYYSAHKEQYKTHHMQYKSQRKEKYEQLLRVLNKPDIPHCEICGREIADGCEGDFHHLRPHQKNNSVKRLLLNGARLTEKTIEEARKCILLCPQCHRILHQYSYDYAHVLATLRKLRSFWHDD